MRKPHTVVVAIDIDAEGADFEAIVAALLDVPHVVDVQDAATYDHGETEREESCRIRIPAAVGDSEVGFRGRCTSHLSGMRCELRSGHGPYHKNKAAGWEDDRSVSTRAAVELATVRETKP